MLKKIAMLITAACLFGINPCAYAKDEALPQVMDKLKVRVKRPKSDTDSFSSEAKVVYLSGYKYVRVEEAFANLGVQRKKATLDEKPVYKYEHLVDGKLHLTLWTSVDKDIPLQISLREGKHVQTIRYEDYQKNIAFEPELFKLPSGFKISEPKHK